MEQKATKQFLCILATCGVLIGCQGPSGHKPDVAKLAPLPIQQARAYGETVTGLFVSLVDFEDTPDGPSGFDQVEYFTIGPAGRTGTRKFVVNVTRTGTGALGPESQLIFTSPDVRNLAGYTLLTMALHSEALRDDLQVTLVSPSGNWTSHRTLVTAGWNNVLIDIQRLASVERFNITRVRELRIAFAEAAGDVTFNVDDIMLINNRRRLEPTPPGVTLAKRGLDYELTLPGRGAKPLQLRQCADGLWRLDRHQAAVRLAGPGEELSPGRDDLRLMGRRKVGRVAVVECNPIRLRLINTWYFPTRAGEWASLGIRKIRWEYTFYGDGRWVTGVRLNNAGGQEIALAALLLGESAAWDDGAVGDARSEVDFVGPVARWNYMWAAPGANRQAMEQAYMDPGHIEVLMGRGDVFAPGDANHDRFDESQGCYFLQADRAGHCRFKLYPGSTGVHGAVFRVAGRWGGKVSINVAGLAVRIAARLGDESVLFVVPAHITRPTRIEVTGKVHADRR